MTVQVLYFASLKDRTGIARETVEVAHDATVESLWTALVGRHPALGDFGARPLVACDQVYATWTAPLDGVTEVAFLPPVSGG